jgi:polyferredoxin
MEETKKKQFLPVLIPLFFGTALSLSLGLTIWLGFFFVFIPIGFSISLGLFINRSRPDLGRKISLTLIAFDLLFFLGVLQHENLQIEETVIYLAYFINTGIFTRVLIHYAVAKVFGPLIFGRGYCGWACYTAALLEWLPINKNNKVPKKYTYIRFPILIISIVIPFLLIKNGYNYMDAHIRLPKTDQFIWFLFGNCIYYIIGILLAVIFQKKRAFCKICCPVSLVMKLPARISLVKIRSTENKCIECGKCNTVCPMDIDIKNHIKDNQKVLSSECILCRECVKNCPVKAII